MSARTDLLELTPEALTALANAGFVKRAQKDVAAGLLPQLEVDAEGSVRAVFDDGVQTVLAPGRTLRDATCSCSASGMCRHRVMLVLAYQVRVAVDMDPFERWSPVEFDDAALASSFAPAVLEQATKLANAHPVVGVQAGRSASLVPTAQLPMCSVRFFSRSSLAHARCDCKQGSGCAHVVLALWAFRQAALESPGAADVMVELQSRADVTDTTDGTDAPTPMMQGEAARTLCAQIDALLQSLWLDGSAQPALALAARFEAARSQAQALGWCWVDDAIDEVWQLLQAQQARSSRFDPVRLLSVLADLWARLEAARHAGQPGHRPALPASQILGIGVKGEVALDHLRLVSLGAELWADDAFEGASVLFADPDTQAVTVLQRQWPRVVAAGVSTGASSAGTALASRRIAGFSLRQLASGQVITKTAIRRANGLVEITAGVRQTGVLPLSPKSWDDLAEPLHQHSVDSLLAHLRAMPPDFVRPRQTANGAAGVLYVVALEAMEVRSSHWDAQSQVLHAQLSPLAVADGDAVQLPESALHLALPHRTVAPGAVDALARALAGEWGALRAVAGPVRLEGGRAVMQPLSVLTAQRAMVLQVESAAPQALALHSESDEVPPLLALAHDTLALLALLLRQGLRHQAGGASTRAEAQAVRLRHAGLERAAQLLGQAIASLRSTDRSGLVATLAMLSLLVQGLAS